MTITLLTTVARDAARARARRYAARADRPTSRRSAADPASGTRVGGTLSGSLLTREPGDGGRIAFTGMASVTGREYEMHDHSGVYGEIVEPGAFLLSLARAGLDVPLVLAHDQLRRIARTGNASSPLHLEEVTAGAETGLRVTAPSLDPEDADVQHVARKIEAGLIDEMSFAFRIDAGRWSEDFGTFSISAVDLHRGDVAIVGFGANPFTSAAVALATAPVNTGRVRLARLAIARGAAIL